MSSVSTPSPARTADPPKLDTVKSLSTVSNWRGLGKLALVLLVLAASAACASVALTGLYPWLFWPLAALACVWAQHAAAEEVHDGVHYRLLSTHRANDILSGFYSSLIGVSFTEYRTDHTLHHRHFGTPQDPDYSKYAARPEGWGGWLRYGITYFCGLAALRRLLGGGAKPGAQKPGARRALLSQHPLGTAAVQLALWGITALVVSPWWYPLCWILPLLTLTYGLTQFRTLLEHWQDAAEPGAKAGGLFNLGGALRNLFAAPFGYNHHGTHHQYPSVPNYKLGQLNESLGQELAMENGVKTQSYWSRIWAVLRGRKKEKSEVVNSAAVANEVAKGGTLRFYLRTLRTNPGKIIRGVWDTFREMARFLFWPRVRVGVGFWTRAWLLRRFIWAELKVPGGTTTLETIWLAYGAAGATAESSDWAEVGCFKGLSTARLSLLCLLHNQQLHVYDTFEGLPGSDAVYEATDGGVAYHFLAGSYAGTEAEVRANVAAHGCVEQVTLVKGDVRDSLAAKPLPAGLRFAFLDVDLVDSYKSCFSGLAQSIRPGTVIMIHEACYQPIRELIEDEGYWKSIGCSKPQITYVAETYGIRSCRNLAILKWGEEKTGTGR